MSALVADVEVSTELFRAIARIHDAEQLIRGLRDDRDDDASYVGNILRSRKLTRYDAGPLRAEIVTSKEPWCDCCRVNVAICDNAKAGKPISVSYVAVERVVVKPRPGIRSAA